MKQLLLYLFFVFSSLTSFAQYYLRGEIRDERNNLLPYVKLYLHSAKALYYSGAYGSFGFTAPKEYDSLTLSLDGFVSRTVYIKTNEWQNLKLTISASTANLNRPRLISVTKDLKQESRLSWRINDETYFHLVENEIVDARKFPYTGFSLNVNKASYSNVRRFLNAGSKVPPDAVRIEECLNYFNLLYNLPDEDKLFKVITQVTNCPWQYGDQLLYVNISAKKLNLDKVPPGNFVFLIDVSGSMDMPNRLPLLKAGFQNFVKNLRPIDKISIVMYGGTVGIWLPPTSGSEQKIISESIESLSASGDTPGESAILAAYKLAESSFIEGGSNRVILATDGDFNVGQSSEKALEELIVKKRQTGIYLTCLGVGMGNFKDSKLETLAKNGNGNYAYIDDSFEAEKVLIKELTQTFYAVADDVSLNVSFNPAMVKEYRLLGFDNKKDAFLDASSELEGGDLGSGNSTLAIFQITPTDLNKLTEDFSQAEKIADLQLNFAACEDTSKRSLHFEVPYNLKNINEVGNEYKFASAVTLFGMLLKRSKYIGAGSWPLVKALAENAADKTRFLENQFVNLVNKAENIYDPPKGKRGRRKGE